jgi:hypothetical protein
MPPHFCWKFPGFLLLAALLLGGCGVTGPGLRQEVQGDLRSTREGISQVEKSYDSNEYFGYSSPDPDQWNTTDLTRWVELHGGG